MTQPSNPSRRLFLAAGLAGAVFAALAKAVAAERGPQATSPEPRRFHGRLYLIDYDNDRAWIEIDPETGEPLNH